MHKTDLKALTRTEVEQFLKESGFPLFRARQLLHWIYERNARSIAEITEFSKALRDALSERAFISSLNLLDRQVSRDGTEKFLFGMQDRETIESVLISEEDRLTLCISSQAGCAMGCKFCLTGKLGLKRNLLAHEIIDQVISVEREIEPKVITNIVLMGMGEPLANFHNTVEALWRMTDLMKISPRKITLSTAGLAPYIMKLPQEAPMVNLAVSLNATTEETRAYLMPINKRYPLKALMDACRCFPLPARRRITFEYVLIKGINDMPEDAQRLVQLLKGIPSKVNLIPLNPFKGCRFDRPEDARAFVFQKILLKARMTALIRKSKGQDICAACGQLKAQHEAKQEQAPFQAV
jgi:23S rRNA (adenine2503-C2)-methyltransferase